MNTTILALALALAPVATNPVPRSFDVADVEIERGAQSTQIMIFGPDGEQSAAIEVWSEAGVVNLEVDFADGLYLSQTIGDEIDQIESESNDAEEVATRLTLIDDYLADNPPQEGREFLCLAGVLGAYSCVVGAIPACMVAGVVIGCNCLPLVGDYPPGCGY